MATVGEKLTYIMKNDCDYITDKKLGDSLHVDRSAVSKWRSGELNFNKDEYAPVAADFFIKNISRAQLLSLLELPADASCGDGELCGHIVDFLFDGKKLPTDITGGDEDEEEVIIGRPVENKGCFSYKKATPMPVRAGSGTGRWRSILRLCRLRTGTGSWNRHGSMQKPE